MIIAITGVAGSGKSTTAKLIAAKLNYKYYSIGELQRKLAHEKNISMAELRELEEKDPNFDKKFDDYQRSLGVDEDNFIIDSRLSSLFLPNAFKVFLDCDDDVRFRRIMHDDNQIRTLTNDDKSKQAVLDRDEGDIRRYKKHYNYDYLDKNNYDLVVDTSHLPPDAVALRVLEAFKKFKIKF